MNIMIAICLAAMAGIVVATVIRLCCLGRAQRLNFLKNYKNGSFALVYLVALPLYCLGMYVQQGETDWFGAFVNALGACVKTVVLEFSYDSVSLLAEQNVLYRVAIITCYVLSAVNAVLLIATLSGRTISNGIRTLRAKRSKKVYVFVGYNDNNKTIIQSINGKTPIVLLADVTEETADYAFICKVGLAKYADGDDLGAVLVKLFGNFAEKQVSVIVNTGCDQQNLVCTEQLARIIQKNNLARFGIDDTRGLKAHVFGASNNTSSFMHVVEDTNGCIQFVCTNKLVAIDFVNRYPLTQFMTKQHLNYHTATLRPNVDVNVVMVGFGLTNQQIFLTSVANNQFLAQGEKGVCEQPVHYYIYDREDARRNKNLNHDYFRYVHEVDQPHDKYLPLPQKPADEHFFHMDLSAPDFYDSVRHNIEAKTLKDGGKTTPYNYVIVALGNDMRNLDVAEKLSLKLKEWGMDEVSHVFVRIVDGNLTELINRQYAASGFVTFGNVDQVVYNIDQIVAERVEMMAKDKHLSYAMAGCSSAEEEQTAKIIALDKWYNQQQIQRESNVYGCLSIRSKLHLLGYDYAPTEDGRADASAQFMQHYQQGDPIVYNADAPTVRGKRPIVYTNNYVVGTLRHTLAVHEHQRWNAYMICCGVIPSTIEEIKAGKGKNMAMRKHGNITTFDGLVEFRKLEAARRGVSEEDTDVIRYDYQIMDDLVWMLSNGGYKIIKK